jgi:hypothetical protein
MIKEEKSILKSIGNDEVFHVILQKLTIGDQLTEQEKTYILASAILFITHYQKDKRYTSYADLSYYIILKYALTSNDYKPLFDFSINFGFFPITKAILYDGLVQNQEINNAFIDLQLTKFRKNSNYFETFEQYSISRKFLEDNTLEKTFIAPTSFGKSSVIIDYVKNLSTSDHKIVVVVPTKSLLMQTYQMIKSSNLQRKIIIHDEMYNNESSFIAIFTQERSLRFLNKNKTHFDILFIDEAHILLEKDPRSILLSRLISRNRVANPDQRVVYLSPLLADTNNLKLKRDQVISSHIIKFNIKEPEIFEYRLNNEILQYNRFVDQFYLLEREENKFSYIKKTSKNKNFVYLRKPTSIEAFAKELCKNLAQIESKDLIELETNLKREVHKDFYGVKYLKYGIVYLHGKIPDLIKEYLESKFKVVNELKYVIANSVILEGMNLPIDNLIILNTKSLNGKDLMNLIGRVNRLNNIFSPQKNDLDKLLPKVHFVNSIEYNGQYNMTSKIEQLRSRIFNDSVENPMLDSYELPKKITADDKAKIVNIQTEENFLFNNSTLQSDVIKRYLIENGINKFYWKVEKLLSQIIYTQDSIKNNKNFEWQSRTFMDKLYFIFLSDSANICDSEFARLAKVEARNYYDNYILINRKKSLNENIVSQFGYFKNKQKSNNFYTYIGLPYGEIAKDGEVDTNYRKNVFFNPVTKSDDELINLAIVKLKIEDDFISFKLNKFIVMLYDFDFISQNEYNLYIYGTTDMHKINLTKYGLGINLITRLEEADQIKNLSFDPFNNLIGNQQFDNYKNSLNDFYRFEINRFLS